MSTINDATLQFSVGARIRIDHKFGTIKYFGEIDGCTGAWLGVEWDNPQNGKHNGCVHGNYYFHTQIPGAGSFLRPAKIDPFQTLEQAARERYLSFSAESFLNTTLTRQARKEMNAPDLEVLGMEKVARMQSFERLFDVGVEGCPVNSAGYLKDFQRLQTLNLSSSLIWNWEIVADIVKQIPSLLELNLSCNRLVLPTAEQVIAFEPVFRKLRSIILRNCGYTRWSDVVQTARLWPQIQGLALVQNPLVEFGEVNCGDVFKNLRELDLRDTKITSFKEVCKLGNIPTLTLLNLMENGIEEVKLPECEPTEKLPIFISLEQLSLLFNPIMCETAVFNELDKLPKLKRLNMKSNSQNSNFDETFLKAVGMISGLVLFNRVKVTSDDRNKAELVMWERYAREWLDVVKYPDLLQDFYKKHRTYISVIKEYGSPRIGEIVGPPNSRSPMKCVSSN